MKSPWGSLLEEPGVSVADHGIEPGEELPGASNQRNFLGLGSILEPLLVAPAGICAGAKGRLYRDLR
jgi:hypothetical protein